MTLKLPSPRNFLFFFPCSVSFFLLLVLHKSFHSMAAYNLHYTSAFRLHKPTLSSFSYRPILCHAPRKITTSQDQSSYCASITADIEAHLKQAIPLKSPQCVYEPMHHMTFSAPPNPAPALCVAACELVGGDRSKAMAAASALHLMHAASFTHEHLTDRPKPKLTVDRPFNPNIELLIPDAMVPFGYELLAVSDDPTQDTSGQVLRVIVQLARAMGSQGIVDAQYREVLVSPLAGRELNDIEWVDDMCRRKEGRLHACAAACGAILGGANEEEVERLRKYGLYVGIMQGYTNRLGRSVKELERVVELRNLALKELDHFKGRKIKEEKYIFFYGGKDTELIQQFTKKVTALQSEPAFKDTKINIELFLVGKTTRGGEDSSIIGRFWNGIESLFVSKSHKQVDPVTQDIQKLLAYKNDSAWAVLSKGSTVITAGHGSAILKVVEDVDKWKDVVKEKGFEATFKEYHSRITKTVRYCSHIDVPVVAGKVPETLKCPECPRTMETYISYKCCHIDGPNGHH